MLWISMGNINCEDCLYNAKRLYKWRMNITKTDFFEMTKQIKLKTERFINRPVLVF